METDKMTAAQQICKFVSERRPSDVMSVASAEISKRVMGMINNRRSEVGQKLFNR